MTEEDTFRILKRKSLADLEYDWDNVGGVYEEWAAKKTSTNSMIGPWGAYLKHNGWTFDEYTKWLHKNYQK